MRDIGVFVYNNKKVCAGIIAYNEEKSIGKVADDFKSQMPLIDEIIIVDNNSKDMTNEIAKASGATVVKEEKQGYGNACQRAMKECLDAGAGIIILTEGDASFSASDSTKLLAYTNDADLVLGTRTNPALIGQGAKMNKFLLWGNIFLAKLIKWKFFSKKFRVSDVGCTYRAIRADALRKIQPHFSVGGSSFSPEMIVLAARNNLKIIEIPVNYKERIGESKITSSFSKSLKLGLRMIWLILRR